MNYCCRCQSMYSQPGTCNCFAPPRPVITTPHTLPIEVPINTGTPIPIPQRTIITSGSIPGDTTITVAGGTWVNTGLDVPVRA